MTMNTYHAIQGKIPDFSGQPEFSSAPIWAENTAAYGVRVLVKTSQDHKGLGVLPRLSREAVLRTFFHGRAPTN